MFTDTLEAALNYGLLIVYVKISVAWANKTLEFQLPGSLSSLFFFCRQFAFKKISAFMWLSNKIQFLSGTICNLI